MKTILLSRFLVLSVSCAAFGIAAVAKAEDFSLKLTHSSAKDLVSEWASSVDALFLRGFPVEGSGVSSDKLRGANLVLARAKVLVMEREDSHEGVLTEFESRRLLDVETIGSVSRLFGVVNHIWNNSTDSALQNRVMRIVMLSIEHAEQISKQSQAIDFVKRACETETHAQFLARLDSTIQRAEHSARLKLKARPALAEILQELEELRESCSLLQDGDTGSSPKSQE